jgi:hypothetical protein
VKPTLTFEKLHKVMADYVEQSPDAATLGGTIWSAPPLVRAFAAGLAQVLTTAIYDACGDPTPEPVVVVCEVALASVEVSEVPAC